MEGGRGESQDGHRNGAQPTVVREPDLGGEHPVGDQQDHGRPADDRRVRKGNQKRHRQGCQLTCRSGTAAEAYAEHRRVMLTRSCETVFPQPIDLVKKKRRDNQSHRREPKSHPHPRLLRE
ncbi:hypothetical protein GCM10022295_61170 [Streptomyces osmaniensis]|uniref:Uncharacterized protein n=1 Tax=Streptomyces osmaniensis TaxID=593134 RepID=A0ABP6XQM5_9ACTN